jgi:hypothetical protein
MSVLEVTPEPEAVIVAEPTLRIGRAALALVVPWANVTLELPTTPGVSDVRVTVKAPARLALAGIVTFTVTLEPTYTNGCGDARPIVTAPLSTT